MIISMILFMTIIFQLEQWVVVPPGSGRPYTLHAIYAQLHFMNCWFKLIIMIIIRIMIMIIILFMTMIFQLEQRAVVPPGSGRPCPVSNSYPNGYDCDQIMIVIRLWLWSDYDCDQIMIELWLDYDWIMIRLWLNYD